MTPRPRPRSVVDKGMAASKAHEGEDDDIAEVGVQTPLRVREPPDVTSAPEWGHGKVNIAREVA